MTSSTTTTKDFEPTNHPSEVLKPTENLGQQQTPAGQNLAGTAINSSEASLEKDRDEVDSSQKYGNKAGESNKYSSTSSGLIVTNASLPAPAPASTEKIKLDKGGEEGPGFEDDSEEDDSDDDFPKFEGGESRGRVVNPYAGRPTVKPRPK